MDARDLRRACSQGRDREIGLSSDIWGIWYGDLMNAKLGASERASMTIEESVEAI